MTPNEMRDLEREIGRALHGLPTPRAPRSLLPGVLRAVQTLPVEPPAGMAWPPLARAAVAAFALLAVAGVIWYWPAGTVVQALLPDPVQDANRQASVLAATASDLLRIGSLVWQAVVAPIVKGLFAITAILCAVGALFAAALGRLALGGAQS